MMSEIPTQMISQLILRYAEPHRRYHTWSHIGACFDAIEKISSDRSQEVALALFYHDAIYEPLKKGNEVRSAALLMAEGERAGIDESVLKKAGMMILATDHDGCLEVTQQGCAVVDADLSILGAEDIVFNRYEDAIREEFGSVPDVTFAAGRVKVMQRFLDRDVIFLTKAARDLWEDKARANVGRSLRRWGGSS
jgi:predicted metal-dependent HD superfamily phosphohydrolase